MRVPPKIKRQRQPADDIQKLIKDVKAKPNELVLAAFKITEEERHNYYRRLKRAGLHVISRRIYRDPEGAVENDRYAIWVAKEAGSAKDRKRREQSGEK